MVDLQKHKLIVGSEVTNETDINALGNMAVETCNDLGLYLEDHVDVLADKGYHNATDLSYCQENNISTYVAERKQEGSSPKPEGFRKKDFSYDKEEDVYICPQGEQLTTNGRLYNKSSNNGKSSYRFKRYTITYSKCDHCPFKEQCLSKSSQQQRHGRYIERHEHEEALEINAENLAKNPGLYKTRQHIVEHPFGTIKRSWGYTYTLMKGLEKVDGEWSMIHLVYNLRRCMSILGVQGLVEALRTGKIPLNGPFSVIWKILKVLKRIFLGVNLNPKLFQLPSKVLRMSYFGVVG